MSQNARNYFLPLVFGAALISLSESAYAQRVQVEASKPEFDDLMSPDFAGGERKAFKPKNWLEMEAKLKVVMDPEPPSKACERLTVRWFVAVQNPDRPKTFLLLTKDVEHVNVPLAEDVYVSIYLSPSSVKRLTGSDRVGKGVVEVVGYEVLVNGKEVAAETTKNKAGWWNAASPNISRSETVPLLTKPQTPFSSMWWDRYAEVLQPMSR